MAWKASANLARYLLWDSTLLFFQFQLYIQRKHDKHDLHSCKFNGCHVSFKLSSQVFFSVIRMTMKVFPQIYEHFLIAETEK